MKKRKKRFKLPEKYKTESHRQFQRRTGYISIKPLKFKWIDAKDLK